MHAWKPTRAQIQAAHGQTVPDLIGPGLSVLFCGINPSLYSAAVGQHFARPGNRFWPALELGGFTTRRLSPFESDVLLELGYGITNVVDRATSSAEELTARDLKDGGAKLVAKVSQYQPKIVAFLGIGSYRIAFGNQDAVVGPQAHQIAATKVWVVPNPSGLNAHYRLEALGALFGELRQAATF